MKLSSAIILASMVTTVAASKSISGKNAAKVLRASRRMEEDGDDAAEDEYAYLANYNIKMISCKSDETVLNPETGEYSTGAAVFRLCPTENGCSDESAKGCDSGYGEYVVGLGTFVEAYFEDQKDNWEGDDAFEADRYTECNEYDPEYEGDDDVDPYENYAFYIGPTCTDDESDVKLAVFEDETCTTSSSFTFEEISQGNTLPYEDGGLVSSYCFDCSQVNDDGEYELRDMCMELYEATAYSCEADMPYVNELYGPNSNGCEYISELMPVAVESKSGGKVFGWIVFILIAIGAIGYVAWWRKKKSASSDGLVA